jgi:hypothetical protein
LEEFIKDISYYSGFLSILSGLAFYKQLNKGQKLFLVYVVYLMVVENLNYYVIEKYHNNLWLWDLGFSIEFVFYTFFYKKFIGFRKSEFVIFITVAIYVFVSLYLKYFVYLNFNDINYILPVIMMLSIYMNASVVIKTFDKNNTGFNNNYLFWIAFARILYFAIILPFNVFTYVGYHMESEISKTYYGLDNIVNHLANTALNCLFAYSFYVKAK